MRRWRPVGRSRIDDRVFFRSLICSFARFWSRERTDAPGRSRRHGELEGTGPAVSKRRVVDSCRLGSELLPPLAVAADPRLLPTSSYAIIVDIAAAVAAAASPYDVIRERRMLSSHARSRRDEISLTRARVIPSYLEMGFPLLPFRLLCSFFKFLRFLNSEFLLTDKYLWKCETPPFGISETAAFIGNRDSWCCWLYQFFLHRDFKKFVFGAAFYSNS